mgnify:CR=1 FL=1
MQVVGAGAALLKVPDRAWLAGTSLIFLAALGALAAHAGGGSVSGGARRVTVWGALAMLATAGVGALFGTVV